MNRILTLSLGIVCLLSGLDSSAFAGRDTTKTLIQKGKDQVRMSEARHHFLSHSYHAALEIYEELYFDNMESAKIAYKLGECHFALRDYSSAAKLIGKALKIDTEVTEEGHLLYAKALHMTEDLDKALEEYQAHKKTIKSTKPKHHKEIDRFIASAKLAKEKMANPLDVKITNAGKAINSAFDDYGPSISSDGKTLIFTSRRPDTKGGAIDVDGKYFEDIMISTWDDQLNIWGKAEGVKGRLNTEYHDGCLSISPDGRYIYVYRNYGENGSGEIYVSKMSSSGKWGATKPVLHANTTYWESSATLTADGSKMFYVSENKATNKMQGIGVDKDGNLKKSAPFGRGDIYMIEKISRKEWSEPVNLGPVLNTDGDEKMVFVHPDGNVLFFSSNGHVGIGGYDIYMSKLKDGVWQKPTLLEYPINTVKNDINFILTRDNKTAYYSGKKTTGLGETDIYTIDVSNYDLIAGIKKMTVDYNITVMGGGAPMKAKVTVLDNSGNELRAVKTDDSGKFSMKMSAGKTYKIHIKPYGAFAVYTEDLVLKAEQGGTVIKKDIALKAK